MVSEQRFFPESFSIQSSLLRSFLCDLHCCIAFIYGNFCVAFIATPDLFFSSHSSSFFVPENSCALPSFFKTALNLRCLVLPPWQLDNFIHGHIQARLIRILIYGLNTINNLVTPKILASRFMIRAPLPFCLLLLSRMLLCVP